MEDDFSLLKNTFPVSSLLTIEQSLLAAWDQIFIMRSFLGPTLKSFSCPFVDDAGRRALLWLSKIPSFTQIGGTFSCASVAYEYWRCIYLYEHYHARPYFSDDSRVCSDYKSSLPPSRTSVTVSSRKHWVCSVNLNALYLGIRSQMFRGSKNIFGHCYGKIISRSVLENDYYIENPFTLKFFKVSKCRVEMFFE